MEVHWKINMKEVGTRAVEEEIKNRDLHSTVQETLLLFRETCERLLREYPNPGRLCLRKRNLVDLKATKILKN
ncbi:hypothetical protein QJS10_CPB17g01397 [Acorus calamus]|uniref:Uncharacterized protein n=1 Tax=Acorus calamus TaxID=4465 RepID=A0AAV9CS32_ACOCL|nr:hypothetical protein QJS10_CPB17g01397 [Acorus calamus]